MEQRRTSPTSGGRSFSRGGRPAQAGGRTGGKGGYAPRTASTSGYSRGTFTGGRPSAPRAGGGERGGYAPRTESTPRTGYQGHSPRPAYTPRDSRPSEGGRSFARPYTPRTGSSSFGDRGGSRFGGGRSGGFSGGGRRSGGGNRGRDERIDPNRYINKAVITEEIEHFTPEHQFTDFKIVETLKKAIVAKGYVNPTPIQDRSIPHTLQGVDVVGIANTGTGKTGAFLIPLINKALVKPEESILVIVPTRELALQIDEELQGFVKGMRVHSVCCFGGANISRQIEALKSHRHFVIGTPGRLKDLIERKKLNLSKFRTVVLDEADRMLDMGFVNDMRMILALVQKERQTLFFSATLSPDIEKLIGEFLTEPVRISVKTRDTSKNIDQDVIRVPRGSDKFEILKDLLGKPGFERVLVFGRTKHGVDKLEKQLNRAGVKTESIHGNKNNSKRQQALRMFKDGRVRVLVATDVAARGLDIANVSHVINFDVPATYDDYVHRIGRTGRAEKKGIALTMIEV